jgi:hypothetical protein
MMSKFKTFGAVALFIVMLSVSGFAGQKHTGSSHTGSNHTAVGTIASMSDNQLVVNEKVKGKEQPVTFKLDSSTQKSGNLHQGTLVTVQYHSDKSEKVASSVRERSTNGTETKAK